MRATNLLILLCFGVSLYSWFTSPEIASKDFAFSTRHFLEGKIWTAISALFLHANWMHLLGNMLFLYVFGNTLEALQGTGKFLSAFFVGGVGTFLIGTLFYPADLLMVGASAAIFTLASTVMLINPLRFSFLLLMPVGLVALLYFAYNLIAVYYNVQSNVAFLGHIIGFLLGLPMGIVWSPRWKRNLAISLGLLLLYELLIGLAPLLLPH